MSIEAIVWAWQQRPAHTDSKLVLLALADQAGAEGWVAPSWGHVAQKCGIDGLHVHECVQLLAAAQLLELPETPRPGAIYRGFCRLPIGEHA